jgi:hypothetical protein
MDWGQTFDGLTLEGVLYTKIFLFMLLISLGLGDYSD